MKLRTTILLLLLNVVVIAVLLMQDPKEMPRMGELGAANRVVETPLSEALGLSVEGSLVEQSYAFKKDKIDWVLEKPYEWLANPFAVRRMLSRLDAAKREVAFSVNEIFRRNQSLEDFGLHDPQLTIGIQFKDGWTYYKIGAPVEIGDRVYMLGPNESTIMVVNSSILEPFLQPIDSLHSQALFSIPVFEVQSFVIEFTDRSTRGRFSKRNGRWMIDSPFVGRADESLVRSALDTLTDASVEFVEYSADLARQLREQSIGRIEIVGNRRNSTLIIGNYESDGVEDTEHYLAKMDHLNTYFLIEQRLVDSWRDAQNALRERLIFPFLRGDVTKIRIFEGGAQPEILQLLKLENREWRMFEGVDNQVLDDFEVDNGVIDSLLDSALDLLIDEFVFETPSDEILESFGLKEPQKSLRFETEESWELLIGEVSEKRGLYYAKSSESPTVFLVRLDAMIDWQTNPYYFKNRRIDLVAQDEEIVTFTFQSSINDTVVSSEDLDSFGAFNGSEWVVEDAEVKSLEIKALLNDFQTDGYIPNFDLWLADQTLAEVPSFDFELLVKVESEDRIQTKIIELTERLSGGIQLGRVKDEPLVFKLSQNWIDALHPILFDQELPETYRAPLQNPESSEVKEPESENVSE